MATLIMIRCASCGAGLPFTGRESAVRCLHCGATTTAPSGLGQALTGSARARTAQDQAEAALAQAWHEASRPSRLISSVLAVASLFVAVSLGSAVSFLGSTRQISMEATMALTYGIVLTWFIGTPLAFLLHDLLLRQRARGWVAALVQRQSTQQSRCCCPDCGGPLQIPRMVTAIDCPFCRQVLFVNAGTVQRWMQEAWQLNAALQQAARSLVSENAARAAREAWLVPLVTMGLLMGGQLVLGIVLTIASAYAGF